MAAPDEIRRFALALPGALEVDHHGFPSFRVAGKIFATLRADPPRLMVKLDLEDQHNFVEGHPDRITAVPGYWGRKGSTLVDPQLDLATIETLLRLAWSRAAPKRAGGTA